MLKQQLKQQQQQQHVGFEPKVHAAKNMRKYFAIHLQMSGAGTKCGGRRGLTRRMRLLLIKIQN